jgi:predicted neuraminidase
MIRSIALLLFGLAPAGAEAPALLTKEFIYESAPFPSCHASTLAETASGKLVVSFFGGIKEKDPSVGIWVSRHESGKWTAPVEVADGVQADGTRLPCWNPVLIAPRKPVGAPLLLFYKVGPTPDTWWGLLKTSADDGKTWSEAKRLPDGILGPIKNKPVEMPDGSLLCPSSTEHDGWRVHFEHTADLGATWTKTERIPNAEGADIFAIQPSILFRKDGSLYALGRTRQKFLFETLSTDAGKTWSPVKLTEVPNPSSGTDAVTLKDGKHLLIYNPVSTPKTRSPLSIAISDDDAKSWKPWVTLEDEPGKEFSYPAIIQTLDGKIHATYTWRREKVRHVVLDAPK